MTRSGDLHPEIITLAGTYFSCGSDLSLSFRGVQPFTIEGWFGFAALGAMGASIFSKPSEIVLGLTARGHAFVHHHSRQHLVVGTSALAAGPWHHLGVTCDGKRMMLYVNGRPEASASELDGKGRATRLTGGAWTAMPELDCRVRDFRIWSLVRSPAEMLRSTWAPVVPQAGLVANFFPELPQLPTEPQAALEELARLSHVA